MIDNQRRTIAATSILLVAGAIAACASDGDPAGDENVPASVADAPDGIDQEVTSPSEATTAPSIAETATTSTSTTTEPTSPTTTAPVVPPTSAQSEAEPPAIGWRTVEVIDPTRPTDEVIREGSVVLEAATDRTIPVEIVYPAEGDGGQDASHAAGVTRPLVIWINGLGGRAAPGDPLLLALHDAGYIVAAPNSPEVSAPAGQDNDVPELPADAAAVIDALVDPTDGVADDLQPAIDSTRIGAAGHSVGANAVLALAFHDCCRDDRIDAVAAYGSARLEAHGFADLAVEGVPLLLITGSADAIAPTAGSQTVFDRGSESTYLLEIDGADHFQPIYDGAETATGATSIEALVAFFDVHLSGEGESSVLFQVGAERGNATWQPS